MRRMLTEKQLKELNPETKLYTHNIYVGKAGEAFGSATIITDDNTAFTYTTLATYLASNGCTTNTKILQASGMAITIDAETEVETDYPIYGMFSADSKIKFAYATGDAITMSAAATLSDTVIEF